MARTPNQTCEICVKLKAVSQENQPQPVFPRDERWEWRYDPRSTWAKELRTEGFPRLGPAYPAPVKRLYVRENGQYVSIGSICEVGHVVLDGPVVEDEPRHLLTPGLPPRVVCLNTGEVVDTVRKAP